MLEIGGHSYGRVTVTMVTATDIFFTSSSGLYNAKLADLSPALQKYFHYNAAKAAEAEQAEAQASLRYYESLAAVRHSVAAPTVDDQVMDLFSKAWGRLGLSRIYLVAFLLLPALLFLTSLAAFFSGRRSMRARQDFDRRLASLALVELNKSAAVRQIASGPSHSQS